jgi:hypothetical protein
MSHDAELLAYKLAGCLKTFLEAPDVKMRDICEQALGEYYHYLRGGSYFNRWYLRLWWWLANRRGTK